MSKKLPSRNFVCGQYQDFRLQLWSLDNELNESVVLDELSVDVANDLEEELQYNVRVIGDKHGKTSNGRA